MGILLSKVRVSNFRSIESMAIDLGIENLLIGQNNTGKTNFLRAISIAVAGVTDITENDIFVAQGERLDKTKKAIIDIVFKPTDGNGEVCREFSEYWTYAFTESWISTDIDGSFVGIRTVISYDVLRDGYVTVRYRITKWGDDESTTTVENTRTPFTDDMRSFLQTYYMDANRDIVNDLRNRKSYFGRITSSHDMDDNKVAEIEKQLSEVNELIIKNIPSLQQTKERISAIGKTMGTDSSSVEIEPLARKLSDLNKGMDIVMQDGAAASFPISQHGSGTRSWISFLTLAAFVENQNEKLKADDNAEQYFVLTMEEPESHLHPQAQRQLFDQISRFPGQKIVSTHSPYVVAQSALGNVIHFSKREGKTTAIRYIADTQDDQKIFREVINTRADLLFASAIILCEGITEELALPIFFREYFGCAPFSLGVNIVGAGGKDGYKPFLSLSKQFNIPWFIFGDGEKEAKNSARTAIRNIYNVDIKKVALPNVIMFGSGDDYEKHLVHAGYTDIIIQSICELEEDDEFFEKYMRTHHGNPRKGGSIRNYWHEEGRNEALIDLCHERKTKYAQNIASSLVSQSDKSKRVPPTVKLLFSALATKLGVGNVSSEEVDE